MTLLAGPDGHADDSLDADPVLLMHDLEAALRRLAEDQVRCALQVGALKIAGHSRAEILGQLSITARDYTSAVAALRAALTNEA